MDISDGEYAEEEQGTGKDFTVESADNSATCVEDSTVSEGFTTTCLDDTEDDLNISSTVVSFSSSDVESSSVEIEISSSDGDISSDDLYLGITAVKYLFNEDVPDGEHTEDHHVAAVELSVDNTATGVEDSTVCEDRSALCSDNTSSHVGDPSRRFNNRRDVVVDLQVKKYILHSKVLMEHSSFFREKLEDHRAEGGFSIVHVPSGYTSTEAFESLIGYMYTGNFHDFNIHSILAVSIAAHHLGFRAVEDLFCQCCSVSHRGSESKGGPAVAKRKTISSSDFLDEEYAEEVQVTGVASPVESADNTATCVEDSTVSEGFTTTCLDDAADDLKIYSAVVNTSSSDVSSKPGVLVDLQEDQYLQYRKVVMENFAFFKEKLEDMIYAEGDYSIVKIPPGCISNEAFEFTIDYMYERRSTNFNFRNFEVMASAVQYLGITAVKDLLSEDVPHGEHTEDHHVAVVELSVDNSATGVEDSTVCEDHSALSSDNTSSDVEDSSPNFNNRRNVLVDLQEKLYLLHGKVLKEHSSFFREKLEDIRAEGGFSIVHVPSSYISTQAFESLIGYMYTGHFYDFNTHNIQAVSIAARHLGTRAVDDLFSQCCSVCRRRSDSEGGPAVHHDQHMMLQRKNLNEFKEGKNRN